MNDTALSAAYIAGFPAEAAAFVQGLPTESLREELDGLSPRAVISLMDRMTPSRALELFGVLDPGIQREVLVLAPARLGTMLLSLLDAERRESILGMLSEGVRDDYARMLQYPDDTAGRLMDRAVDTVRSGHTVREARELLRRSGIEHARTIYTVDADNRLLARLDVQDLALAEESDRVDDHFRPLQAVVSATDPREEVVTLLDRHRTDSIPVVDTDGRLQGVVRYATLFTEIEDAAAASMQKMVGASPDERALSSPWFAVKRRLPWLHINLLTAFLAAAVVGVFESLIAQFTALAVLLPVVAGQSGNAGSQALAVTIRGLAVKEIGTREWRRVLNKELVVGVANGLALAVTCGAGVFWWSGSTGLAIVIAVAMVLSMVAAGLSGALVPVILTRLGQDPATASSIILTTVTDVSGFLSFLGTATALSFMI